jgi:hypothetical protein
MNMNRNNTGKFIMNLVALVMLTTTGAQAAVIYSDAVLADNPVAYYRLNETSGTTAVNLTGTTALNGTYINFGGSNPSLTSTGPRPPSFDGFESDNVSKAFNGGTSATQSTSAYTRVEVADQAALDITGALTLEAWINPTSLGTTNRGIVAKFRGQLSNGTSVNERAYSLYLDGNGKLGFILSTDGSFAGSTSFLGSTTISTNTWQHVAAVYDPDGSVNLYLNGALDGSFTTGVPSSIADTDAPLWIGQQFNLNGQGAFIGLIDEVAIYNTALSGTQISNHYDVAVIPEPSTLVLLGLAGLTSLSLLRRRRR